MERIGSDPVDVSIRDTRGALLHARLSNPDVQDPDEEVTGECV